MLNASRQAEIGVIKGPLSGNMANNEVIGQEDWRYLNSDRFSPL